ncbi:DNA-directed RNA polymerase II subunit [Marasmius crinis-equi]|uniref:DNA-directed RNA polymerase II subunit n=1 Tax=Marasmius crinis-equi TaxID=585013 RepID=A0ABR3EPF7_9AGAR
MFFIKELTHIILLHPSYFGPRMLNFLESKLYSDVEGTCSGQFGHIIAVVSILDIGKGMVLSGSGQAEFITRYRAIVFKPFKHENQSRILGKVKVAFGGDDDDGGVFGGVEDDGNDDEGEGGGGDEDEMAVGALRQAYSVLEEWEEEEAVSGLGRCRGYLQRRG